MANIYIIIVQNPCASDLILQPVSIFESTGCKDYCKL